MVDIQAALAKEGSSRPPLHSWQALVAPTPPIRPLRLPTLACDLSEEAVILSMGTGLYHGLNEVGTYIWKLVQNPTTVGDLRDSILEQYDVEREKCWQDLISLLEEMRKAELIEIGEGDGG